TGESTIVVPFTSQDNASTHYRIAVRPTTANGLDRLCWLQVDKLGAIRTSWLARTIGRLDAESLSRCRLLAAELMSPARADE
ncbi:MAG: type II toxin-antitoxin system PemK/MazF family toxin, partial [Propionibacteriaceae bacterium]|nr:type II toxin-antitoxin system PemK/MazF family toxin [Propionibacteriaceae bacterium]